MTKKDFELIASVVRAQYAKAKAIKGDSVVRQVTVTDLACSLASALLRDNPRFDTTRFLEACGFAPLKGLPEEGK